MDSQEGNTSYKVHALIYKKHPLSSISCAVLFSDSDLFSFFSPWFFFLRRGAAVGARLAAIRFAEATFAAPVDLTTDIDRSDPAKTQAISYLAVDGFASGGLLPASFFALAKNLAALAGEAEDPAFLEPIANALWTASDSARRVGAESALASALVAALSGAADAFEVCEPPAGARFASAAEAEGAAFAFARGVATRTPPHPARRLAELIAAFGLACRGQGPIAAVVELQ